MTGLIYVILIAVWGVVLVPRWLRRHDESKNADQSEALEAALNGDSGVEGAGDELRAASWSEYVRGLAEVDMSGVTSVLRPGTTGSSPAARRRGRIMIGLAVTAGVTGLGAVAGLLPSSLLMISLMLLGGYVSAMFYFMRKQEGVLSVGDVGVGVSRSQQAMGQAVAAGATVDGVRVVGESSDAWEPQAQTLPTYVTKTKASKIPRRIDLTSGWTGADMVAQAREQQASPDLEQQFKREWAAVEPDQDAEVERYASGHDEEERYYRRAVNE